MPPSSFPTNESTRPADFRPKPLDAEIIRALTPIFIAAIGGIIGITVLVIDADSDEFGLASTAIAGAAGLAQPYKELGQKND